MNKRLLLALAVLVLSATAGWLYYLHGRGDSSGTYHVRTEFQFTVHAPYNVAAPLFGPGGERAWATDSWNPRFLYPQPAKDVQVAVFQVHRGRRRSTWVNTAFDLEQGHIQYVYIIPEAMVTVIDLHLTRPNPDSTDVHVAYERTALKASANEHVRQFGEADRNNGKQWGDDIERYLAAQRRP
jgi:hypothetical protein